MSNQEAQENGNGGTPEGAVEINANFEPLTEDQLIGFAKWLKAREHHSVIKSRWLFGRAINRSSETVYGENTAGRIAEEVGYSKSTVHKSREFAQKYSDEQLASLLDGPFLIFWRDVAQNLSVSPEDFLRTYHESRNPEQFRNSVTQFKRTRSTRNQTQREPRKTIAQLEAENVELQKKVSELETEKVKLQARIQELEGQQEPSGEIPDSAEDNVLVEELSI